MRTIVVKRPDGKTITPQLSGIGETLWLAEYGKEVKLLLKREKSTLYITVLVIPAEKGFKLLHKNKVITSLETDALSMIFNIKLKPDVEPPFPPKLYVPEREIPCSVIITSYNMKDMLKETLTSLNPQLSKQDEIIVVDDGSDDETDKMIKKYFPDIKYIQQERKGYRQQRARNIGIQKAQNDCVILLDADCDPLPYFIRAHKYYFNPKKVLTGKLFRADRNGKTCDENITAKRNILTEDELYKIRCGNLCFSRSEIMKIGGFTEDYDGAWGYDDQDFAYKVIYLLGAKIHINPEARVIHKYRFTPHERGDMERNKTILKHKIEEYTKRRIKLPVNVLIIVDIYGWAWDIASKELVQHLPNIYSRIVDIADFKEKRVNPDRFDVVLVYPWATKWLMDRLNPKNTVVCIAGGGQLDARKAFEYNCSKFNILGANNKQIEQVLKTRYPKKKILLLSHGTDTEKFKPQRIPHEKFVVGWVGRTHRFIKRFQLAQKITEEAGVTLKVAGYKAEDENYLPHQEMPSFYNSVDCLLVTSIHEAHPLVVYEAMSCGLPVITTKVGDVEETIIDGENGFIIPVDADSSEFAAAIQRLMDNPELTKQIGEKARETILKKWTWNKIATQYEDLFPVCVSPKPRLKIGILWWQSRFLRKTVEDVALSKEALERLGVTVREFDPKDVFPRYAGHPELSVKEDLLRELNNCDVIWTSIYDVVLNEEPRKKIKPPIMFQVDGYGKTSFHNGYVNPKLVNLTNVCDLVTFLDMNVCEVFKASNMNFNYDEMFFVPNGRINLPASEKTPFSRRNGKKLVGSLMTENPYKKPEHFLSATNLLSDDVNIIYPILDFQGFSEPHKLKLVQMFGGPVLTEPGFVKLKNLPKVNFVPFIPREMVRSFMLDCDVFVHYTSGDAFSKTISEAFDSGVAPIVSDIIRVQGISRSSLQTAKDQVGKPMSQAYKATHNLFTTGNGQHLTIVPKEQPKLLAEAISEALKNPKQLATMGAEAKEWSNDWITWYDKWETIIELAERRRLT